MVKLLPRLNPVQVENILAQLGSNADSRGVSWMETQHRAASYAASGGHMVSFSELEKLRAQVVEVARAFGMPSPGTMYSRANFDSETAILLADHELLTSPEALRDDVWAFLATVMLPHVVIWRFGSKERLSRFKGGVRNALQRLWLRATVLDRGSEDADHRWLLVRSLTEDAFVQIVERPSIANDRQLAIGLAEGWLRAAERIGRGRMEGVMRKSTIMLRLRNQIQFMSGLDKPEFDSLIDDIFYRASGNL